MRRRSEENAETLGALFRALREYSAREGERLPPHSLLVLAYLGLRPDGAAGFAEVKDACGLGQSRTSRIVAALTGHGLISSVTPADDKRRTLLRLTEHGSSLLGTITKASRSRA